MLKRTLRVLLVSFLAISILPAVPARAAGAGMRLTKTIGPPTTKTTVQGHGFGASEGVHIRFDSMPVGSATTDPSGAFRKTIAVPASALPGAHTVSARGDISHLTAQAPFTVRTDWAAFRFDRYR